MRPSALRAQLLGSRVVCSPSNPASASCLVRSRRRELPLAVRKRRLSPPQAGEGYVRQLAAAALRTGAAAGSAAASSASATRCCSAFNAPGRCEP